MSKLNNKPLKYNLLDYLIPCFLVIFALAISYYILDQAESINDKYYKAYHNTYSEFDDKDYEKALTTLTPGIIKTKDGKYHLITYSAQSVYLPGHLYPGIKYTIVDHIMTSEEIADNNEIYENSQTLPYYLKLYSKLLKTLASNLEDPLNKSMLTSLAEYATEISEIITKLIVIRDDISKVKLNYELSKLSYQKETYNWKKVWIRYFDCLKQPLLKDCPVSYDEISEVFTNLNSAYLDYRMASTIYLDKCNEYKADSARYFRELNDYIGPNFELLLSSVTDYSLLPNDIKRITIDISNEIKDIKNKIKLSNTSITMVTSTIEINKPNINEDFDYAESYEIVIDENDKLNINCIANCIFNSKSNCYEICKKAKLN